MTPVSIFSMIPDIIRDRISRATPTPATIPPLSQRDPTPSHFPVLIVEQVAFKVRVKPAVVL
jgi:hypothetical protein